MVAAGAGVCAGGRREVAAAAVIGRGELDLQDPVSGGHADREGTAARDLHSVIAAVIVAARTEGNGRFFDGRIHVRLDRHGLDFALDGQAGRGGEFTGLDPVDFSRRFNIPYELYMEWERAAKADEGKPCEYADRDNFGFPIYNKWMPQAPCNSNPPRCPRYVVYMLAQLCGMVDILEIPAVQTADKAAENDD